MERDKQHRIDKISIDMHEKMSRAMQVMDENHVKLLIVNEGGKFRSLVSIGDIQRALLRSVPLESPVADVLRPKINVCREKDDFPTIRKKMLKLRTECMPVVNEAGDLVDIHFWEDVFGEDRNRVQKHLDLPVIIMAPSPL